MLESRCRRGRPPSPPSNAPNQTDAGEVDLQVPQVILRTKPMHAGASQGRARLARHFLGSNSAESAFHDPRGLPTSQHLRDPTEHAIHHVEAGATFRVDTPHPPNAFSSGCDDTGPGHSADTTRSREAHKQRALACPCSSSAAHGITTVQQSRTQGVRPPMLETKTSTQANRRSLGRFPALPL